MLESLFTVYVFLQTLLCGCAADKRHAGFENGRAAYSIQRIGKMDKRKVKESSGFETSNDSNLWTHADGGNPAELYKVNTTGKLLQTLKIPNAVNIDWEDITRDETGYLYIGDFGNNYNNRKNLRIFRIKESNPNQVDTILFSYADQKAFPPAKSDWTYDCEGFYYFDQHLYLFSKNRSPKKAVKLYKLPATPGSYVASPLDSIELASRITAADISPDGRTVALLGYGNLYIFDTRKGEVVFKGNKKCLSIKSSGQAEALIFLNNHDFVFGNEGGKIFKATRK